MATIKSTDDTYKQLIEENKIIILILALDVHLAQPVPVLTQ